MLSKISVWAKRCFDLCGCCTASFMAEKDTNSSAAQRSGVFAGLIEGDSKLAEGPTRHEQGKRNLDHQKSQDNFKSEILIQSR